MKQPTSSSVAPGDDIALVPAGETEFARDKAFGYRSSNLVDWIGEKAAAAVAEGGPEHGVSAAAAAAATDRVVSVSLRDLREGGPTVVRQRLKEAKGGCVVVNAVEERDLQVRKAEPITLEKGWSQFLLNLRLSEQPAFARHMRRFCFGRLGLGLGLDSLCRMTTPTPTNSRYGRCGCGSVDCSWTVQ